MAKYQVKHLCGHTTEVQLFGHWSDRERRMAAMERELCAACRAEQARQAAAEAGLPALTGSDKQIAWAAEIRDTAIWRAKGTARAEKVAEAAQKQTRAAWWIDNRGAF